MERFVLEKYGNFKVVVLIVEGYKHDSLAKFWQILESLMQFYLHWLALWNGEYCCQDSCQSRIILQPKLPIQSHSTWEWISKYRLNWNLLFTHRKSTSVDQLIVLWLASWRVIVEVYVENISWLSKTRTHFEGMKLVAWKVIGMIYLASGRDCVLKREAAFVVEDAPGESLAEQRVVLLLHFQTSAQYPLPIEVVLVMQFEHWHAERIFKNILWYQFKRYFLSHIVKWHSYFANVSHLA